MVRRAAVLISLMVGVQVFGSVALIHEAPGGTPAAHGLKRLALSLEDNQAECIVLSRDDERAYDFYMFAGLSSGNSPVALLLDGLRIPRPEGREALQVSRTTYKGKPCLLLCGGDEVGLMYAALDVAKRISWSGDPKDPFKYVVDIAESPDVPERTVSIGTFNRTYFESRLHDPAYWEAYFDMMAENRLNTFLLIFGYKNNQYKEPNFTAPVYPNFFNVSEFPDIGMSNVTPEQQRKNCESLQVMMDLAHERGIEFGVGLWDQIERSKQYLKMADGEGEMPADFQPNLVWGLTKENLIPYTKIAMRQFFEKFPDIDLVQFRMHWESGIEGEVALKFWKEIFGMIKEQSPDIKIEARAKDVPDETLYDGVDTGADFRVVTKHWMEQMGMPFHPTHVNRENQHDRRHGYADLLRYPRKYGFKWRVWSGGTTRALLWGDPEWVKLFAEGSHLYDGVGFEFNEPMYFKMNGSRHDAPTTDLLNPEYQYYDHEFERYWHYFQVMGRVGYNPDTPSDVWEMEFEQRFGYEAGPLVMEALHDASRILPRIVTASYLYPRFASPQGWPELQRMESLKHFAEKSVPSDIQQFASPMEEAELCMRGGYTVRRTPSQTSEWFRQTAGRVLANVSKADQAIAGYPTKEFTSTITDLKMLARLGLYHANRLDAAVQYNLFKCSGDPAFFDKAIEYESRAVAAYGGMVDAAGDVYNMKLDFGSNKGLFPGHWKDEHRRLVNELAQLKKEREAFEPARITPPKRLPKVERKDSNPPVAAIDRVETAPLNQSLKITVRVEDPSGIEFVNLRYRRVSQFEDYETAPMVLDQSTGRYEAEIPASMFDGTYDVMYFVEAMDRVGNGRMFPDLEVETPYVIVKLKR